MKVKQHIPNFVSGVDPKEVIVSSQEELLSIPFVVTFRYLVEFFRYSISNNKYLIAEYKGGGEWWVVAHLYEIDCELSLPVWNSEEANKKKMKLEYGLPLTATFW